MRQESNERVHGFLSRLKAKARQCDLSTSCECGKFVDYTDQLNLYMLVADFNDLETEEDLLSLDSLTLDTDETNSVAKESSKFSQCE